MQDWQYSIIEKFKSARTLPRVRCEMGLLVKALDFEFWSYGQTSYQHFTKPNTLVMGNLPVKWQQFYQAQNYGAIDPVIEHGLHSSESVVWDDALYAKYPNMWEEAKSFGLQTGWSQSARDAKNSTVGILSLVRTHKAVSRIEIQEKQLRMHWLTHAMHSKVTKLQNEK
jgi:LuxR family transcriptional regulator